MENEVKLYQLRSGFAKHNNLLIYFAGVKLAETERAVYLYGRGTTETTKMGICCKCGRVLTHPVSVELGIGPECGQHFHDWDLIGGYNKANLERLKGALVNIKFDHWVTKSQIEAVHLSTESIEIPADHPILIKRNGNAVTVNARSGTNLELPKQRAVLKQDSQGNKVVQIIFPYNLETLEKIRSLPGRKFHQEQKNWSAPIYPETIKHLQDWGFSLDEKLKELIQHTEEKKGDIKEIQHFPELKKQLYPFQKEGVSFIEFCNGRALLADEMGLGKTIQALAWLQLHPELRPAIVITPASLKLNWSREIYTWTTNQTVQILSGTTSYPTPKKPKDIYIINYDILHAWIPMLKGLDAKVLITDECHYYKSRKARRTQSVKMIAKNIPHVIALSGTPIVNRPAEAYNAIKLIAPDLFPDFFMYARLYCNAKQGRFGWDFSGASRTDELHEKLTKSIMIRRLKKDVLKDLPEKVRSFVPMELDNVTEYKSAEKDFIQFIRERKGDKAAARASQAETLTSIETLKQLAVHGKLAQTVEWVYNFLEDSDQKLVIFATHRFVIDGLLAAFKNEAVKLDGSCSVSDRQKAIDSFQNNPNIRLFIGNIQAAGIGITLTAASNVAFIELPWTPGALTQAEDRCHRIGQKDSVNIHYLLAEGTIEEKIAKLLDKKRMVLDSVLDGVMTEQESLLMELIKEYQ